ncbi:YjbF family lipoprotein [Roseomonas sp. USHLN139]|uniref:YjbF family lipoprotein n=1 Tax=Roseomonas sp. USHLN139 TaxID=3081298 RepID=UPI003B029C08
MKSTLALALLLAGCGAFGDGVPRTEPLPEVAEADTDGVPALRLRWSGGQAIALLVQQNGETRLWRSQGGVVVATEGARVMATAGLAAWLAGTRLEGPDPLDDPAALARRPAVLRRLVDLMEEDRDPQAMRFGLVLSCRLSADRQTVALLVTERCHGPGARFTNRYWADPESGGIWRSEQWVGEAGLLQLEVVTPPAS